MPLLRHFHLFTRHAKNQIEQELFVANVLILISFHFPLYAFNSSVTLWPTWYFKYTPAHYPFFVLNSKSSDVVHEVFHMLL